MNLTVDTNVLIRIIVRDDETQAQAALTLLRKAALVAIPLVCLCEVVWVLRRIYRFSTANLAEALVALLGIANVRMNAPAVEAGLAALRAGGDFADGVIAYEGKWLGGEVFASFDKRAVALTKAQGQAAHFIK